MDLSDRNPAHILSGGDSLEKLYNDLKQPVFLLALSVLKDRELAEDAVQETFVKAYKATASFRGECSEKAWLMRIALNTCKDIRRSAWHRYVDRYVTLDCIPDSSYTPTLEQSDLVLSIMNLPKKHMEVVLLYYYQGMTTLEIGHALQISNQTVSTRLKKARERLRLTLERGTDHE